MMKAEDVLFMVDEDEEMFCFVTKEYWDENGCLDDCMDETALKKLLPKGFHNAMESCYTYTVRKNDVVVDNDFEGGRQALILAGFDEIPYAW